MANYNSTSRPRKKWPIVKIKTKDEHTFFAISLDRPVLSTLWTMFRSCSPNILLLSFSAASSILCLSDINVTFLVLFSSSSFVFVSCAIVLFACANLKKYKSQ